MVMDRTDKKGINYADFPLLFHLSRLSNSLFMPLTSIRPPSSSNMPDWNKSLISSPIPCRLSLSLFIFIFYSYISFSSSRRMLFFPKLLGSVSCCRII